MLDLRNLFQRRTVQNYDGFVVEFARGFEKQNPGLYEENPGVYLRRFRAEKDKAWREYQEKSK